MTQKEGGEKRPRGPYPRAPRRGLIAVSTPEVVPLSNLLSPKVVPTFGHRPYSLSATRLGCNHYLVYQLTPADTVLSFGFLRFTYPPVVSGKR